MNKVQGMVQDGILKIVLSGRIDSNNASLVEAETISLAQAQNICRITIDASGLEYISSAGLRVLLHLKKMYPELAICHVHPEVYEILDMTGFTQMMQVEKAYRKVSIEGCEVIGEGANGKLYRIDKDIVVKVYDNPDALDEIQNEREMARCALVLGIPTAISYDVVKVGDRYGSVFELLNARSFAKILQTEPEKEEWCVREFTDMLDQIHRTLVPKGKLPDIRKRVLDWVEYLKAYLPQKYYSKLQALVLEVPEDDHMIHGDYHIKNLELQGDEVLLIDMDTLAVGHPIFELGSMYNAFLGFSEMNHGQVRKFLGIDYELSRDFWNRVLKRYLSTNSEDTVREVEDKARIIGYTRLIRRSIRRQGLQNEAARAEIELWKSLLFELLDRTDTLLFERNGMKTDADINNLPEVLKFVDTRLETAGCGMKSQMQLDVAVEEIFVNIASYAYGDKTGTAEIHMEITEPPKTAVITFIDRGVPFDPLKQEDPDISLGAEQRRIGGLGIFMVKKTMDDISYEYRDGENRLTIRKILI